MYLYAYIYIYICIYIYILCMHMYANIFSSRVRMWITGIALLEIQYSGTPIVGLFSLRYANSKSLFPMYQVSKLMSGGSAATSRPHRGIGGRNVALAAWRWYCVFFNIFLSKAVYKGALEAVTLLLLHGADPNLVSSLSNQRAEARIVFSFSFFRLLAWR